MVVIDNIYAGLQSKLTNGAERNTKCTVWRAKDTDKFNAIQLRLMSEKRL